MCKALDNCFLIITQTSNIHHYLYEYGYGIVSLCVNTAENTAGNETEQHQYNFK